jgi:hypothetical protein
MSNGDGILNGALNELAKQGDFINNPSAAAAYQAATSTPMGQVGAQMVQTAAQIAPATIHQIGKATPEVALIVGVGYALYKLWEWLDS